MGSGCISEPSPLPLPVGVAGAAAGRGCCGSGASGPRNKSAGSLVPQAVGQPRANNILDAQGEPCQRPVLVFGNPCVVGSVAENPCPIERGLNQCQQGVIPLCHIVKMCFDPSDSQSAIRAVGCGDARYSHTLVSGYK